jgi:predicted porin
MRDNIQLAAIAAATLAMTSIAQAQSSVTLYGIVDDGPSYTSNAGGHAGWQMVSGSAQGSRWGLKGIEDLGGGLATIFRLENGFNVNNGTLSQGGREFGRQAYFGVTSSTLGTLTLGRQLDMINDFVAPMTANSSWGGYAFSHPFDNDNTDGSFRINNAIKYTSANYGGLNFGATYAFSNATGFAQDREYSAGVQYTNGPLVIAGAYSNVNGLGTSTTGAVTADTAPFVADSERIAGAGIKYAFGPAAVAFVYTYTDIGQPVKNNLVHATLSGSSLRFSNYEINGSYQFTPQFAVMAMYDFTHGDYAASNGTVRPNWNQVGLMGDYLLSKRTDVYMQGVWQHVSGVANDMGGMSGALILGSAGQSSTSSQLLVHVGLRHKF